MRTASRRRLGAVDVAMTFVVRLVVDDGWTELSAGRQLRAQVADDTVLRRVRARVARVLAERASPFGERAIATLDAALALRPPQTFDAAWARRPATTAQHYPS